MPELFGNDPLAEQKLRDKIKLFPPDKQEALYARLDEWKATGVPLRDMERAIDRGILIQRTKAGAPGTHTNELVQNPDAVEIPPGFERKEPTKALGDKKKLAQLGATSTFNLPRDVMNFGATFNRYLTPIGWIRGDSYLDDVEEFHQRIGEAVPLYEDMAQARNLFYDEYIDSAQNKTAAKVAAFGAEMVGDVTNYNPVGLVKSAASVGLKGAALLSVRHALKSAAKGTVRHSPLDLAERSLMRTALEGKDTSKLVDIADELAAKAQVNYGHASNPNIRLVPEAAQEYSHLAKTLDDTAYKLLERAEEINKARAKYGVYLDEVKFTDAELTAANALRQAENLNDVLHFAPESLPPIKEVIKGIAKKEAQKPPAWGGTKTPPLAKFFKFLEKQLGSRGGVPDEIFLERVRAQQRPLAAAFNARRLGNAAKDIIENRYGDPELYNDLGKFMMGQGADLPAELKVIGRELRDSLDEVSGELLKNPDLNPKIAKAIEKNMGQYLHRDFEAFENPFWKQDVSPEIINRAKEHFRKSYDITEDQIEGLVDAALSMKDNPIITLQDNLVGGGGRTILMKRKPLDPTYLALLGEHTDPFHKAVRSSYYLNLAAAEMEFNAKLGPRLVEYGLAMKAPTPTARFTAKLPQTKGYYTTPEMAEILSESTKLSKDGLALGLNGFTKASQTVMSPATHWKNFGSNGWVALSLGHVPNPLDAKAWAGARLLRTEEYIPQKEVVTWVEDLLKEGALGTNVDVGDILEFRNSMDNLTRRIGGKKIADTYGAALEFGTKWYLTGDNYWKVHIYGKELAQYTKAFRAQGIPAEAAEKLAKERAIRVVRDATQNYNFLPKLGRRLRRSIYMGPFASFPLESARNFVNLIAITAEDLADPVTRSIGKRRIAGMLAMATTERAVSHMISSAAKIPRNVLVHANPFLPSYHQGKEIAATEWDGSKLRYRNVSEGNYYNYATTIARTALSPQKDPVEWALSLLLSATEPILGPTLIAGPILEGMQTDGDLGQRTTAAAKEFVGNLAPGVIKQPLEIARAGDVPGVTRILGPEPISRGNRTAIEQAGGYITTMPEYVADIEKRFKFLINEQRRQFNTLKGRDFTSLPDQKQNQIDMQKAWRETTKTAQFLINELKGMDVPQHTIDRWLSDAGYTKLQVAQLRRGDLPSMPIKKYNSLGG